jgi:hypothetical protein
MVMRERRWEVDADGVAGRYGWYKGVRGEMEGI